MSWVDLEAWDLGTIAKTILGAGIGSALVQGLLPLWRDSRQKRSHAAYMAMRIAVAFEAYAATCSGFVQLNENAETHGGDEYPNWDTRLPQLPALPDDTEGWRAIDSKIAGQCLNLRNKTEESILYIRVTIEYSEADIGDVVNVHAASRGIEALALAIRLRKQYDIGPAESEWDYQDLMQQSLQTAEGRIEKRRTRNAARSRDMSKRFSSPPEA
jgi:hypothetical protein